MLPAKFQFVQDMLNEGDAGRQPEPVAIAVAAYGLREGSGQADNPVILDWADQLGLRGVYIHDSIPWCGLAMARFMSGAGFTPPKGVLMLRALEWSNFGEAVMPGEAVFGDVLVFSRTGGGHVGLYVGESTAAFWVLGGNEGDAIAIVPISKDRLHAVRRPPYAQLPPNLRKVTLAATGELSTDEA